MIAAPATRGIGICFVTDRRATLGRPVAEVAQAALEGGAELVQLREKDLPGGELTRCARDLVGRARAFRGRPRVIVNDRLDVALAARAAGVHLPASGLPIHLVRPRVGRRFLIGRSVHSIAEARRAEKEGADYLFFGPVFETPGKAAFGPPQGPAALRRAAESVRIPVWAIGGIRASNLPAIAGLPIAGVAVISAVAGAADPAEAVRALRAALRDEPGSPG
ncbi:MAG: thiamine phosphate synthase [Acidobacteriota bacterium]